MDIQKETGKLLVMEGDWGGQEYVCVSVDLISKPENIWPVLVMLDRIAWSCNGGLGIRAYFRTVEEVEEAEGYGDDGVVPDFWIHSEFSPAIVAQVRTLLGLT